MSQSLCEQLNRVVEMNSFSWTRITDLKNQSIEFNLLLSSVILDEFSNFSADNSPIHMSQKAAQKEGLDDRVVHGAIQAAIVSTLVGEVLPGPRAMIQSSSYKFHRPCYADRQYNYVWSVDQIHESVSVVEANLIVSDIENIKCLKCRIQIGINNHD